MKKTLPFLTAVLSFVLGYFWYSPYFLGDIWLSYRDIKPTDNDMLIASFILMNIMAYAMQWLIHKAKVKKSYFAGFQFGLMIAVCFVCTCLGIIYVYSGHPNFINMWAIDAGYQTTFITLMGTIIAAKNKA